MIAEFVEKLEESFKEDGKVELENIGRFFYSEEKLQFEPFEHVNYLTDSFGLDSFKTSAISRETYKKQVEELEEKEEDVVEKDVVEEVELLVKEILYRNP